MVGDFWQQNDQAQALSGKKKARKLKAPGAPAPCAGVKRDWQGSGLGEGRGGDRRRGNSIRRKSGRNGCLVQGFLSLLKSGMTAEGLGSPALQLQVGRRRHLGGMPQKGWATVLTFRGQKGFCAQGHDCVFHLPRNRKGPCPC